MTVAEGLPGRATVTFPSRPRGFRRLLLVTWAVALLPVASAGGDELRPASVLLDMVFHNPGEPPFDSRYNDPAVSRSLGYTGKIFALFEAAQFGIDWSSLDPALIPPGCPERAWIDAKAAELDRLFDATKAAGLEVYCHTDMVVLPRRLVEKLGLDEFGDLTRENARQVVRAGIREQFDRFPQVDGLVVRIGETYLHGAPHHVGQIRNHTDPEKTIIPLMQLLREEVCERRGKKVFFRSWRSFDIDADAYARVSAGVEPHPLLAIVVKHCENDFHRGNRFSRVLGLGRHPQLVEVQCQREYEGKGAYPNYIMKGVIEGFEEHPASTSVRSFWKSPLALGLVTWSRGGGWQGPYLSNELWCDLNVYVIAKWVQQPDRPEEEVFHEFATDVLHLSADDAGKFRRLALLSADAVYRGKRSTTNAIAPQWTRDEYIDRPPLPKHPQTLPAVVAEKDEAVRLWEEIDGLAREIRFADAATQEYAEVSCRYGLLLYRIYQAGFHLAALGEDGDRNEVERWIAAYDRAWQEFRDLKATHPCCASLYRDKGFRFEPAIGAVEKPGIGAFVDEFRR